MSKDRAFELNRLIKTIERKKVKEKNWYAALNSLILVKADKNHKYETRLRVHSLILEYFIYYLSLGKSHEWCCLMLGIPYKRWCYWLGKHDSVRLLLRSAKQHVSYNKDEREVVKGLKEVDKL